MDSGKVEPAKTAVLDEVGVTVGGKLVNPTDDNSYAKRVKYEDGKFRYYLKKNQGGDPYDPWGPFSELSSGRTVKGLSTWNYKEVDAQDFENYVTFLEKKNSYFLRQIKRFK